MVFGLDKIPMEVSNSIKKLSDNFTKSINQGIYTVGEIVEKGEKNLYKIIKTAEDNILQIVKNGEVIIKDIERNIYNLFLDIEKNIFDTAQLGIGQISARTQQFIDIGQNFETDVFRTVNNTETDITSIIDEGKDQIYHSYNRSFDKYIEIIQFSALTSSLISVFIVNRYGNEIMSLGEDIIKELGKVLDKIAKDGLKFAIL